MRYYVCKTGCKANPDLQQFLNFEIQETKCDNQEHVRMSLCIYKTIYHM